MFIDLGNGITINFYINGEVIIKADNHGNRKRKVKE